MSKSVFGTGEWAHKTANCVEGCSHGCHYCYACANAIRFYRRLVGDWTREVPRPDMIARVCRGPCCRVMFPSAHDITPSNVGECLHAIAAMLRYGHRLLVVTKPHLECIKAICDSAARDRKSDLLFRFTMGSADNVTLRLWEPYAPSFDERLAALQYAHGNGFQTSVSCEPMLDGNILAVVEQVEPLVTDAIWIGKANQMRQRLRINGAPPDVMKQAEVLMALQSDDRIWDLYHQLEAHPKIKWKESIKKVLGLPVACQAGMDE